MSNGKSSKTEDEYFAKEDAEKKKRLERRLHDERAQKERAELKEICYLKCPKCAGELHELLFRGVTIDRCDDCNGVWLDDGELDKLAGSEDGNIIRDFIGMFKK
ncbi:MAG: zf-TFIIB domain-containing protein [Candidatus Dadabacteria bacterium]|nr:zf-TFIIB domain-containing protein [Candidatus Dadabacteria bacterium]NIS09365.1 zf-TFIIB domain-containing protein [Candidatus Dadabacteria bacterium]NIV42375.1 hypothetical protein [Candidatus Dadabacteria bacterium]NIX15901.1 hypothetical protein [Candidatus Dadabacteria bacterium]NIY22608.1 hypothetical protein [Candidatus Dadabacteria bacterium]